MSLILTRLHNQSVLLRDFNLNDPILLTVRQIKSRGFQLQFFAPQYLKINRVELTSRIINELKMEGKTHEEIKTFIQKIKKLSFEEIADQLCQEIHWRDQEI